MPNTDYRISVSWRRNRKRLKLQKKLGSDGVLALIDLWAATAEEAPSGKLAGWSIEDIGLAAGWTGDNQVFVEALKELRLLDFDDDSQSYSVHDWQEHNGWAATAEARSKKARLAARVRWGDGVSASGIDNECVQNALSMRGACELQSSSPQPFLPKPIPFPTPAETEEYIKRATRLAADQGEIRTSEERFAAGLRRKIEEEGGYLSQDRESELQKWRTREEESRQRRLGLEQREEDDEREKAVLADEVETRYQRFQNLPVLERGKICRAIWGQDVEPSGTISIIRRCQIAEWMKGQEDAISVCSKV